MSDQKETEIKRITRSANCDIFNGEDRIILKLEMPGVSKENLEVKVDKDILIINGKKRLTSDEGKYLIKETRAGDYHQEFSLDDTIDRDNIDATIKNGVVTLILSLKESVKPRKIQIKAG